MHQAVRVHCFTKPCPVCVTVSFYNSDLESWPPGVAFELTGPDWQVIYATGSTHNMTMMWKDKKTQICAVHCNHLYADLLY